MKTQKTLFLLFWLLAMPMVRAQEIPMNHTLGEKFNDRHKYSNLLAIADDGNGGAVLVRSYYGGIVLRPKGYLIERYDAGLNLLSEYNYKLKDGNFVDAFVNNGQVHLIFLDYDHERSEYDYVVHRSPISDYQFTEERLLSIPSQQVDDPVDKNYYNRNFSSGFTTSLLFDDDRKAFAITTHFKKGKNNKHFIHVFNTKLQKILEHDFSDEVEEKNYAFENVAFSKNLDKAYLIGKAYFKKKRIGATERKFQYELVALSAQGGQTQSFDVPGKFSEGLKPMVLEKRLLCIGFYADRKNNRYNGLSYFALDPQTLEVKTKKYNPFSEEFMLDKFGREDDKEIKNLVFKNATVNADGSMLFNAEEYFVTSSVQANSSGGRVKIDRFHYNDIVSAKLDPNGNVEWIRNINKAEVTQNDGAYASYSSYVENGNTYFFISTAAENPQLLPGERLLFKQGLSRNRNVFVIKLDPQGRISYEKLIDDKEARLPLMVSKPLIDRKEDKLLFYAKRGSKKQLAKVTIQNNSR